METPWQKPKMQKKEKKGKKSDFEFKDLINVLA